MFLFIIYIWLHMCCGVVCMCTCVYACARACVSIAQFTSNQMSFADVRFVFKTASVRGQDRVGDASQDGRITSRCHCTTQADRNVGSIVSYRIVIYGRRSKPLSPSPC